MLVFLYLISDQYTFGKAINVNLHAQLIKSPVFVKRKINMSFAEFSLIVNESQTQKKGNRKEFSSPRKIPNTDIPKGRFGTLFPKLVSHIRINSFLLLRPSHRSLSEHVFQSLPEREKRGGPCFSPSICSYLGLILTCSFHSTWISFQSPAKNQSYCEERLLI